VEVGGDLRSRCEHSPQRTHTPHNAATHKRITHTTLHGDNAFVACITHEAVAGA